MIFQKVKDYCRKNNLSISAFGNGTVGRWENDNSKPSLQTLEKMERATGVPIIEWVS